MLAEIVDEVYAIERISELAEATKKRLEELGVESVRVRQGDGWDGWPEAAPLSRSRSRSAFPFWIRFSAGLVASSLRVNRLLSLRLAR